MAACQEAIPNPTPHPHPDHVPHPHPHPHPVPVPDWPPANKLGELVAVGEGGTTTQESCSTHNMMRLTRGLLLTSVDDNEALTHAAYHERALYRPPLSHTTPLDLT
jgi:hypothetical protein